MDQITLQQALERLTTVQRFSFQSSINRMVNIKNVISEMIENFGYKLSYENKLWCLTKNPLAKNYGKIYDLRIDNIKENRRILLQSPYGESFLVIRNYEEDETQMLQFFICLDKEEISGYYSHPVVFLGRILGQGFWPQDENPENIQLENPQLEEEDEISDKKIFFNYRTGIFFEEDSSEKEESHE